MRQLIAALALFLTACAAVQAAPAVRFPVQRTTYEIHGVVSALEPRPSVPRAKRVVTRTVRPLIRAPAGAVATKSPTQPSTPRPPVHTGGAIDRMIAGIFARIAPGYTSVALCIADRESHDEPWVINPRSGSAGLFQWMSRTWDTYSRRYGFGGASRLDGYANATVAAYVMRDHGLGDWGGGC